MFEIPLDHLHKLSPDGDDISSLKRSIVLPFYIDLKLGSFCISWDKYTNISIFRLPDPIDDTAHDRDMCTLESFIFSWPFGHLLTNPLFHIFCEDLKLIWASTSTSWTAHDLWLKSPKPHRLEDISTDLDFEGTWSAWLWRKRDADSITYPLLKKYRKCSSRWAHSLGSCACLSQPEMEWIETLRCDTLICSDHMLECGHLHWDDNLLWSKSPFDGFLRREYPRFDHRINIDIFSWFRMDECRICLHIKIEEFLIERTTIHSDSDRLIVLYSSTDNLVIVIIMTAPLSDISRIHTVFCYGTSHIRIFLEEDMPIVVKISDDRGLISFFTELADNLWSCLCCCLSIDRDAHYLRASVSKLDNLCDCGMDIPSRGIGHGLDDDRMIGAKSYVSYLDGMSFSSWKKHDRKEIFMIVSNKREKSRKYCKKNLLSEKFRRS